MNHIDSFQHSHLGDLFGLPLFHPIDSINNEININNLMLGGRFGEQSAFVIKDIENCVRYYLAFRTGLFWDPDHELPSAEYVNHWSIQECWDVYPEISPFMKKHGITSPEIAIYMAVGDYLASMAKSFSGRLNLIDRTLAEKAASLKGYWNVVDTPATPGVFGRLDLNDGTVLGISLLEEIKYFDQIRPVVSMSQISAMEGAVIASNTNLKFTMQKEH